MPNGANGPMVSADMGSDPSDLDLQEVLADPEIADITNTLRRTALIARMIGEGDGSGSHITQGFPNAEMLREAFAGRLKQIPDEFLKESMDSLHLRWQSVIKAHGITDDELIAGLRKVWIYGRLTDPTVESFESAISLLEGTEDTAVFATGLAAINAVVQQFTKPAGLINMRKGDEGDEGFQSGEFNEHSEVPSKQKQGWMFFERVKPGKIVVVGSIYGGTFAQMQYNKNRTGRDVCYMTISEFMSQGLPDDTDMAYCEASNNPMLRVVPLDRVVSEAKRVSELRGKRVVTVVDNTFTPLIVRPADHGVDFVVHSTTKYLGGRSEHLGGSVSGRADDIAQFRGLGDGERMLHGANMDRGVAGKFLDGMHDLPERLLRATVNARKVKVIAEKYGWKVRHIESDMEGYGSRYAEIRNEKIPPAISNGMICIDFGSAEKARKFVDMMISEGIGKGAVSLGSVTTYYSIPAETTHSEMPAKEQLRVGITPGVVRISCGVEPDLAEKFEMVAEKLDS